MSDKKITQNMLEDFNFVAKQLRSMGTGFDRNAAVLAVGESIAFGRGALWRERQIMMSVLPFLESVTLDPNCGEKVKAQAEHLRREFLS